MMFIQPIDTETKQQVSAEVQRYIAVAAELYARPFEPIDVVFNIKGRTAGMYRCFYKKEVRPLVYFTFFSGRSMQQYREIRFNPWLFAKYPEDSWCNTIPHEVAHYIADCCYGLKNIKPHGKEWQGIMNDFNAAPIVKGDYNLDGIPLRKTRRYAYQCGCRKIELSSIRHRRIQSGQQIYRCRDCSQVVNLCHGKA